MMSTLDRVATTLDTLWFTRCPVPTATGIAADLGWLASEFEGDGIQIRSLQDAGADVPREEHFAHGLAALVREGGNVPALWARSQGAPTRLIGLTWIEERQVIVTRPGFGVTEPAELVGLRIAVPRRPIAIDFWRAMALAGFAGALSLVERDLDDVRRTEFEVSPETDASGGQWAADLQALRDGQVDAVYLKGAVAVEQARRHGAVVALDLDTLGPRESRVNNGTPRPITVHQYLLDSHPDVVVRFLAVLLEAAQWAQGRPDELLTILSSETGAGQEGAASAYIAAGAPDLRIDLSAERLALLARQERFLAEQGFLSPRVDIEDWSAPQVLESAQALVAQRRDAHAAEHHLNPTKNGAEAARINEGENQ